MYEPFYIGVGCFLIIFLLAKIGVDKINCKHDFNTVATAWGMGPLFSA